ncbi:MAG TPA: flagellar hook-basal body complex protein FliE [Arenimonas sp.]|uniref:flagellar hook-basal body complex protein FliE n=1 Tax=Arenimonas sp. TaxID=1872635 RepID=UPI002D7F12D5|nr:flagellar hook-basal body complex protein FliE [Arenimonas sp.]HEU0153487.1 flagellar hook-basal body complex protein FliE [Arenimonas sp.]
MSIEAIAALSASTGPQATALAHPVRNTEGADFAALLGDGLAKTDAGLKAADENLRAMATGEARPPHEVMISMEEARMNLMLAVEVRNRVVEAYQELIRMQL